MANILPPETLKRVRRAQQARLLFCLGLVATAVALVAFATLIPSYIAIVLGPHPPQALTNAAAASSSSQIIESQNLLSILQPFSTSTSPVEAIRVALSLRPVNVHIDHIEYSNNVSGGTIILGGVAQKPDDIDSFRSLLVGTHQFTQVSVPVSALAGVTNGRFAVTLSGKF